MEKKNNTCYRHMCVESDVFKNNKKESIKTFLHFETVDRSIWAQDFDFEIGVHAEDGFYVISCISDVAYFEQKSDSDLTGELKLSYYDKDAEEYYKFRSGKNEFLHPTIKELEYYGIVPDNALSLENEKYAIITRRPFGMLLEDPDNFLANILNMTKNKNR